MRLNETPALPIAPESVYDRALQRALTDTLRPLLRKVNAIDTREDPPAAPVLVNGWGNYGGGGFPAAGYLLDGLGFVHLRGMISAGAVGAVAFVLPEGCRPAAECYFPAVSAGAFGFAYVSTDGRVTIGAGSAVWFSLDGICFQAK